MTMLPIDYRLLHGLPSVSLSSLTLSGYNGAFLAEREESRPDDRPEMVGAWVDGVYYLGEAEGDSGEWLSAESTVEIKHAR